jgi:putative oxidoreductase
MNSHSHLSGGSAGAFNRSSGSKAVKSGADFFAWTAPFILRWALGVTLLSATLDRFGIWGPPGTPNVAWGDWTHLVAYTAKVNGFLPNTLAPTLAVIATGAEASLGVALILGVFRRRIAFTSALLFARFAGAMTWSFGVKAPLNFSVFADAAAALALSAWPEPPNHKSNAARR